MDRSTDQHSPVLLDRVAISLSGLCILHCLAFPVVLLFVPVAGLSAGNHLHLQALALVLPVSAIALTLGFLAHRHISVIVAGGIGVALLVVGATWAHHEAGLLADRVCTVSGSLILGLAHYANSRLGRRPDIACKADNCSG